METKFNKYEIPETFDWDEKADPAKPVESDLLLNLIVSQEIPDGFHREFTKALTMAFMDDAVTMTSESLNAIPAVIVDVTGKPSDFSRRDMLLIYAGFAMVGVLYSFSKD